jgi:N-acetylglucosamine-6-phosphate deacetylase
MKGFGIGKDNSRIFQPIFSSFILFCYFLGNVMTQVIQNRISTPIDIINARVPGYKDLQMLLVNSEGIIEQILPMGTVFKRLPPANLQVLDVTGDWISLGGVDLQINGALGLAFPELNPENAYFLAKISEFLYNVHNFSRKYSAIAFYNC